MSTFITILVILAVVLLSLYTARTMKSRAQNGCCGSSDSGPAKRVRVRDRSRSHYPYEVKLKVDGIMCSGCCRKIENAFNSHDGCWCRADVSSRTADILLKQKKNIQELSSILKEAGTYTIMDLQWITPAE